MMNGSDLNEIETVLINGACVGCGACAMARPADFAMTWSTDGARVAGLKNGTADEGELKGICPFSNSAPDEDAHGARLFGADLEKDPALGYVRATWAGSAAEDGLRARGSSGGIGTWIALEAMRRGLVDVVVHVKEGGDHALFEYSVSRSLDEIRGGAKTRYYSVDFAVALSTVRNQGLRFALVGVPCFIKAARNLALADQALGQQMVLAISLVCGHMKSARFAESLAWQLGVKPDRIGAIDFRVKRPGSPANMYSFSVTDKKNGKVYTAPMSRLAGRRWDGGYHRLKACDYCDDVFGETADITLGDAWLPEFVKDSGGTNVIVTRSALAENLIADGAASGALLISKLPRERAIASQAGGMRDRREGLSYRLLIDERRGTWHPKKRVEPGEAGLTHFRKLNYRLRRIVRARSANSYRLCLRLGIITPYQLEMTFWHACFRLLQIVENTFGRK